MFRYNRFRAVQILGGPAPGVSSGEAIDAMEKVAAETLPTGYGYEWTGTTYQQKLAQGHEGVIFGFAAVLVFLCLAALYESWSIPFAVLLALPLGLFGALLAVYLRNYPVRHLHPDRHRDADRTGGQERDSDRRVRQGQPRTRRHVGARGGAARRDVCGCGRF